MECPKMTKIAPKTRFTLAAAAVALACVSGATFASAQPGEGPRGDMTRAAFLERTGKMFERMDLTGDGQLDAADRAAAQAQRFGKLDADGNGEVSKTEMQAAHEARKAKMAERMAKREARAAQMMDRRFAMLDKDGSGGVSQAEMAAAREQRGEMKRERKGPGGEAREGRTGQRGERMAEGRGKRGGKAGPGAGHGRKGMMHELARRADVNQDRIVTRAEFDTAVAAHFAQMDADGNGTVTAAERKAARAAHMGERRGRRGGPQGDGQ
jgi:Ca2+-binding EF-hand superfamily protein